MSLPLEIALLSCSPTLPKDIFPKLKASLELLEACDYRALLTSELAEKVLALPEDTGFPEDWASCVSANISTILLGSSGDDDADTLAWELLLLGVACVGTFLQANVTGPPLLFGDVVLLPESTAAGEVEERRKAAIKRLSVDGEEAYHLTPYVFVLTLAKVVLNHPIMAEADAEGVKRTLPWWRVRCNFLHQRVLQEPATTLHSSIYADLERLDKVDFGDKWVRARYLMEKGMVDNYYGNDTKARKHLEEAAACTGLIYAMTGRMGKRTKWQTFDISQLVLLAKSRDEFTKEGEAPPKKLDLNDDTLLEDISFTPNTTAVVEEDHVPEQLSALSLEDPPKLHPLDAAILLLLTEAIKNTSPEDGLTREQMLPYAERVLKHPTNWSVYTAALLVRSRIEGYRSRTAERSVLQLQVLVDQIIAETTRPDDFEGKTGAKTFLPRPTEEESAPVTERLRYIYELPAPTRWEVESELAAKWVNLGAMRTALEIYERLEKWPEVALCYGAVEKEEKAKEIIRALLFEGPMPKSSDEYYNEDEKPPATNGAGSKKERDPPPPEAPRLWCILGDVEKDPKYYERAWEVSGKKFARAQRSLARYYQGKGETAKAAEAYAISLRINAINAPVWFSYGCALLELQRFNDAVEAFTRVVSLDDTDSEGWNNLASALLHRPPKTKQKQTNGTRAEDEESEEDDAKDEQAEALAQRDRNRRDALTALKRAVRLKRDHWRIWENIMIIAASTVPPSYADVCMAMARIIELRGSTAGETCIDLDVLGYLVNHVVQTDYNPDQPGLGRMVVDLVDKHVVPLITNDPRLWGVVAKMALWRKKPSAALESHEKAFRAVSTAYDVKQDGEAWKQLVEATVDVADAYESFGPMERTEGLGAGDGALVMKDWKFKARSAVRGVMGKGRKAGWDTEHASEWATLEELTARFK